jgi:hypothetical protein
VAKFNNTFTVDDDFGPAHCLPALRDYIAELTERVETGKKAGLGVQDLQKQITLESLKTGFLRSLASSSNIPPARQLAAMRTNIIDIYARLDMI